MWWNSAYSRRTKSRTNTHPCSPFLWSYSTSLPTFLLFQLPEWTHLPLPPTAVGTRNKPDYCAGCRFPLSRTSNTIKYHFHYSGFVVDDQTYLPCCTRYHPGCIKAGLPFTTLLPNNGGLSIPNAIKEWPFFICEVCTIRAVLQKELRSTPHEQALLILERVRTLNTLHYWANSTHMAYQSRFTIIHEFEQEFGLRILEPKSLHHLPRAVTPSDSCGLS
jgi:hypothetical protein